MQLIDTYKHIDRREILDCRIKSIKELVRHYRLHINSYEALILSEAYKFNYDRIKIPGISIESFPYATVSHNNVETTFFDNLNISYQEEKIDGNRKGWEYLKGLINRDIPVLFRIDSRYLIGSDDASPKQMKLNLYYLSTLLMVGYNENQGVVLIVLTNSDEKEGVNNITIEEFQKYRHSSCIPFSPEGLCYYLSKENGIESIDNQKIKKAILRSFKNIADFMLSSEKIYHENLGAFIGSEMTQGIHGMERLRDDLNIMLEQYDFKNTEKHKMIKLKMIFLRNNMMFGSYTAFREEFGKSISMCAEKYGIKDFYEIGFEFEKIAQDWKVLFILLSKIAHSTNDLSKKIRSTIEVWEKIIEAEKNQFIKIKEILD